jgi:uncharacterized LabA/DUF88 family protein
VMGVGLFIDGAHLSISWRRITTEQIDFCKLLQSVETEVADRVVEAYCFDATSSGAMTGYFKAMQRAGIRVKLYTFAYEPVYDEQYRPIMDPSTGRQAQRRIQKGVDVGLAMHMVDSHRRRGWDKLVLAASDADFAEPTQRLVEQHNVELTTLGLPERMSHAILPYAVKRLDLRALAPSITRRSLQVVATAPKDRVDEMRYLLS